MASMNDSHNEIQADFYRIIADLHNPRQGRMKIERDERLTGDYPFVVVATDKFMSGWGGAAGGVSYYAIACRDWSEAQEAERMLKSRSEMQRVRVCGRSYRPRGVGHTKIVPWHAIRHAWIGRAGIL